jgi:hypothetical protein
MLNENATCRLTIQCFSPMTCSSAGICQCSKWQYHNINTLACIDQKRYNGTCTVDFNCRADKYLQCLNGLCKCLSSYPVWSNQFGFDSCIVPRTYTEKCFFTTDCDASLNLLCNSVAGDCKCPTQLLANSCDCKRINGEEYYWDGNKCANAHSYGESCINSSTNYMCQTVTQGTYCQGVTNQCKCKTYYFFNTTSLLCLLQGSNGATCTQPDACRSDLGLSCQSNVCKCDGSKQFWNSGKCINYFSYTEGICSDSSQCVSNTNLICRTSGTTSCSCPVTITNGYCDCPTDSSTNEYFWNGTSCAPALGNAEACTGNYQCSYSIKKLTCISGKCDCANGYYNTVSQKCSLCAGGWHYARGYCFKGIYCTSTCSSSYGTAVLAVNLVFPEDSLWLLSYTTSNWNFYGPLGSTNSPVWVKENKTYTIDLSTDYCTGLSSIYYHGQICQYTL